MKYDIKAEKNVIFGRQGFAYVCNSGLYKVLKADADAPQEYDDYKTFDNVRVAYTYKNHEIYKVGTLEVENDNWSVGGSGTCITNSFGFGDMMELVDNANLPIIREGETVVIAKYSKSCEMCVLSFYKVGRINPHCITMADLKPLSDEDMNVIMNDANRWLNR